MNRPAVQLISVGLSHRHAPVAVRERIAQHRAPLSRMLDHLSGLADERVILGTCHRFEAYALTTQADTDVWVERMCRLVDVPMAFAGDHFIVRRGQDTVDHLMGVAAGLDSKVLGEDQILAQVRQAFLSAVDHGTVGPILSAMFRGAIHAGRSVRRDTGINIAPRSFAHLAVRHLIDHNAAQHVAIIGTGAMARESIRALEPQSDARVTIVSRHLERATALAGDQHIAVAPLAALPRVLAASTAVISCTTSRRYLVDAAAIGQRYAPLRMVDLGMPRNIDPELSARRHVHLTHLDDLPEYHALCAETIERAQEITQAAAARFARWLRARRDRPPLDCSAGDSAA